MQNNSNSFLQRVQRIWWYFVTFILVPIVGLMVLSSGFNRMLFPLRGGDSARLLGFLMLVLRNCKIIISDFGCCSERGRHMIPSRAQVYSGDALETRMAYNNRPVILSEATVYAK